VRRSIAAPGAATAGSWALVGAVAAALVLLAAGGVWLLAEVLGTVIG
jgi:hypothetical protein